MHVVQNIQHSDKKVFWSKVFRFKTDVLVAICDKDILGKKVKIEKDFVVEVKKRFYGEKLINAEEVVELLKEATIANLLGDDIVSLALKEGFITKENVIEIGGIPHAQFVKLL